MSTQPILAPADTWFTQGGTTIKRASITEIEIKDSYTPAGEVVASWDASAAKDGSVMVYVEGTKLTIAGNGTGKVYMNSDSSCAFSSTGSDRFGNITKIAGGNLLDTSKVTTLLKAFDRCLSLQEVDVSNWDTSKLVSTKAMFQGCISLEALDLSKWQMDTVSDTSYMFNSIESMGGMKLTTIGDVRNWDLSEVTTMRQMFQFCTSLKNLNTITWKTGACTDMVFMFCKCTSLEELNVSNWDVSNVTSMYGMFHECNNLTTIGDTTNWKTGSCTDMSYMFDNCFSLEELNVSNWDVSKVTTMQRTFVGCTSLKELNVSNWDVSKVTSFCNTFSCGNDYGQVPMTIKELDVSKWNTSSATDMSFMFYGCRSPKTIDVSNWDVSKVTNFDHMTAHSYLTLTGVDNWAPSTACINMNAMFYSIQNTIIDVSKFNTSKVQFFSQMFEHANKLTEIIGLENWDTSFGLGFEEMFQYCSSLKELNLSSFNTTQAKDGVLGSTNGHTTATMRYMFNGMVKLEKITLGENFSFNGDGTTTDPTHHAVLPTPPSGYWYTRTRTKYAPTDIPNNTAATYYASLDLVNNLEYLVKNGSLLDVADSIRTKTGSADPLSFPGGFVSGIEGISTGGNSPEADLALKLWEERSKSTNLGHMFRGCESLTTVPLFDTSQVTDMSYMFRDCDSLITVPLFDTSQVTNMSGMFHYCSSLTTIPQFDTSAVTYISSMFYGCSSLTAVPLLDTSNVTSMSSMFYGCSSLTAVPLFDTGKTTSMSSMFPYCSSLTMVPLLDARNVTSMNSIFYGCSSLTECWLRNIKCNLQVGSGTSYGHLLTVDSLLHLIKECRDTGSVKILTIGAANLEKLANTYVKIVDITDEMRAEDDLIDEKLPFVVCESTDEDAMLITEYIRLKKWSLA